MKRLLGNVALALAVLMMVSSVAMAYDFSDHVKIAPNRKGDVLIFPVYAAINGGWETKFTVINTARDRSVVAKVIFRSAIFSQELLDFLIYLTPTDVWTGIIRYNATTGKPEVFSDDDSCLVSPGVFATTANPFIVPINTPAQPCTNDIYNIGYVEVFESAHTIAGARWMAVGGAALLDLNVAPASKSALYRANLDWPATNGVLALDNINVLTGIEEFRNASLNQRASLEATVLRDYGATQNSNTPLSVVLETFIGEPAADNSIGEFEAAIAKNDLAMYYSSQNLTFHFFTFPTKYTRLATTNAPTCTTFGAFRSPYFGPVVGGRRECIEYEAVNYDRSENSSLAGNIISPATTARMCQEVNWLNTFAFTEGWARYNFSPANNLTQFAVQNTLTPPYINVANDGSYTGAPVFGTVMNLNSTNDGYSMAAAAHTDGLVRDLAASGAAAVVNVPAVVGGINYYYYQYQDERNMGTAGGPTVNAGVNGSGYDANFPAAADESRPVLDGHHPLNPNLP